MEDAHNVQLQRTASQNSTSSGQRSSTVRYKPRKYSSTASLRHGLTPADKSFTSFPSLSPAADASPILPKSSTLIRSKEENKHGKDAVKKTASSPNSLVESLTAAPSSVERAALFDDAPRDTRGVPGNLHHASDEHLQHVLGRVGAVKLIRQMAGDLALRDSQITSLRQKFEERERVLRKMLLDCEISYLDVENRLHDLERSKITEAKHDQTGQKTASFSPMDEHSLDDSIDRRVQMAMEDNMSTFLENREDSEDSTLLSNKRSIYGEQGAMQSSDSLSKTKTSNSKWKTYLWSNQAPGEPQRKISNGSSKRDETPESMGRTRASSAAQPMRRALTNDLFMPPGSDDDTGLDNASGLRRFQSAEYAKSISSQRSSTSVASWALKLVAGNNQSSKQVDKQNVVRGRTTVNSVKAEEVERSPSNDSTRTSRSAKAFTTDYGIPKRGKPLRSSLGPSGTIKSVSPEILRNASSNMTPSSPTEDPNRRMSNSGPVEMDAILPEGTRPPTLLQNHNNFGESQEFLTDRFGFIYDQRRKRRQSEAAAALKSHKGYNGDFTEVEEENFNAKPESLNSSRPESIHSSIEEERPNGSARSEKWTDFLKVTNFPTELLSHTPSSGPADSNVSTEVESTPKISQISMDKRGSVPAASTNPQPAPSRIISGNAEFASVSAAGFPTGPVTPIKSPPDPVKALLEQLTEVHDSLQKEKTIKWNEFLRKVRAERKREGTSAAQEGRTKTLNMPENLLTDGEIIGVAGLGVKGNAGRAKWNEFRLLVLGGIPVAYRAKIWAECSGATALRQPGYYEDLVKGGTDDPTILAQIQMDITRTLTDNIFFRRGPGVHKLNEVLVAYSRRNTEVGYCQGMNLIAACLLIIMPTAEDAFWVLASMVENILPQHYYDHSLLTSRADQFVLRQYVADLLPKLSRHLDNLNIELEALTFQWFLSVFTDCLSAEALFRVWDVVLCMQDGSTFLFQVALALLKLNEKALLSCDTPANLYHYINHQMTNHAISIDGLIQASEALKRVVKRKEVEERRARAVDKELEVMRQREELRRERTFGKMKRDNAAEIEVVPKNLPETLQNQKICNSAKADENIPVVSTASSARPQQFDLEDNDINDIEGRTPMPIDEEALWRA